MSLIIMSRYCIFFFQAEDGIRDLVRSRGLGDVYKRQALRTVTAPFGRGEVIDVDGHPLELVLVKNPAGFTLSLIHI